MQQPKIIELPKFTDPRGNLSFLENENQFPFKIAPVTGFMMYHGEKPVGTGI